jgi:hypothetical protein
MLRRVVGYIVPDISKDLTALIFRLKQSKEVRKLLKNRAVSTSNLAQVTLFCFELHSIKTGSTECLNKQN